MKLRKYLKFIIITWVLFSTSCSQSQVIKGKGDLQLKRVEYSQLNGWALDDHQAALQSFLNSCVRFNQMKPDTEIGNKIGKIKVKDFYNICHEADSIKTQDADQVRIFFEKSFVPFEVSDAKGNEIGKFTGYFEPILEGSLEKNEIYQYPVYGKPDDYERYNRGEIEEGALIGRNLELLYVKDNVDLFFMHVQGTGRVELPDGRILKLAYNGKNNKIYRSIGNEMITSKVIESGNYSYDSMKQWLRENPEKGQDIMNLNESYVYFKISGSDEVVGAQLVPLTAERSLAIDKNLLPYGYPIWLEVNSKKGTDLIFSKLMVTQDTGTAIRGAVRGDIYFGGGHEAGKIAAKMNNRGTYYIFLPVKVASTLE